MIWAVSGIAGSLTRSFARRALASFLLVGTLGLTACVKRETRVARGNREGVLWINNGTDPADVDPQTINGEPESKLMAALFEGLVTLDPDDPDCSRVAPGVAERWDVSPDGRTYTFHLRADARWSDGAPVTADDFRQSYQRILSPRLGSPYADSFYVVAGAEDYHKGKTTDFATVGFRAPDPRTFEVTLRERTPFFLLLLENQCWLPVPVATIQKFGPLDRKAVPWTRPENIVSNGPFRLRDWRPQQELVMVPNAQYWDAKTVRLKEIHFLTVDSLDVEERLFRAGELHETFELPLSKLDAYRRNHPEQLAITPYLGCYFYRFNVTRPPLNDPRVRRALAMALDRESIVRNITRAGQQPAYSYVPPSGAYRPTAILPADLEGARRLLAEAGFPNGRGLPKIPVLFNTLESHRAIAEGVQAMWQKNLGVEVELVNQEFKVYINSGHQLDYTVSRAGWIGDYNDPYSFLGIMRTGDGNNDTGWSNPEYDRLLAESFRATDPATRVATLQRAEAVLLGDMPLAPLFFYTRFKLQQPSVKGKRSNLLDHPQWKHVYLQP